LGGVRRAMARIAALALDTLEHRRLLAADVGAGAAAQPQIARRRQPGRLDFRDLPEQDLAHGRVFVAQVDVDRLGLDRPRGDQRALEEAVRIALQVVAVLDRAGLALVGVDREVARLRLLLTNSHLRPVGKPAPPSPRRPAWLSWPSSSSTAWSG